MIHYLHRKLFQLVAYLNRLSVANPNKNEPNRINSITQLRSLGYYRRSVYWNHGELGQFYSRKPARFILNWSADKVDRMIADGLYLYTKKQ